MSAKYCGRVHQIFTEFKGEAKMFKKTLQMFEYVTLYNNVVD